MSKNDTFTTSATEVPDTNKKLKFKSTSTSSIYRDEVFKDIVRYKFTAAILIKYTLKDYQHLHPIEIARLIKDTKEHNIINDEELLQDEIDTINLTQGTGIEKNTENDFVFEIYKDANKDLTNIITINFEMQEKFYKDKPNTISRAVYYGGTLLRSTVPAGDTYYTNLHKVYTIWFCNAKVHFQEWNTEKICKTLGKECFLYKHKYNIRRSYDECPTFVVPPEQESDLIEIDFVELPVLRKKIENGEAERAEELFLQFMEDTSNSLPVMEKEYGVNLMKYKRGVNETMSITERFELKLQEANKETEEANRRAEEANRKAEEANKRKVHNAVRLCFKFQMEKEQAYAIVLEEDPDISPELLKSTIQEIYGE